MGAKAVVQEKKAEQRERNASRAAKEVERMLTLQLRRTERKAAFVRTQLEAQIEEGEAFRGRMHDTLVNHERATLVAHKRRSTELGMELEVIVRDRDELEAERDKILEYVDEMQESVRAIERRFTRIRRIPPSVRMAASTSPTRRRRSAWTTTTRCSCWASRSKGTPSPKRTRGCNA